MNVTKLYLSNVFMPIDFLQTDYVQRPHDRFINIWQIVSKLTIINYTSSHFQFSISQRKYNLFALREQRRAYMLCKH